MVSYLRLCNNGSTIITFIITGDKHADYYIQCTRFGLTFAFLCDSSLTGCSQKPCVPDSGRGANAARIFVDKSALLKGIFEIYI